MEASRWRFGALALRRALAGAIIAQHSLPRDRPLRQSDRPWSPDDGKRDLPQLRALDPMPALGDVGVVPYILNCIVKLA